MFPAGSSQSGFEDIRVGKHGQSGMGRGEGTDLVVLGDSKEPWMTTIRRTGNFRDVVVRVGSRKFDLHLLPLRNECALFRKMFEESDFMKSGKLYSGQLPVIDLPDFPGGEQMFDVVMDYVHGITDYEISVENFVGFIAASKYLGMDNLKQKALIFLEENILKDWDACLKLLAKLGHNVVEENIYNRCQQALLMKLKTSNPFRRQESSEELKDVMFCNVALFPSIGELPPKLCSYIFNSLIKENIGLYYRQSGSEESSVTPIRFPSSSQKSPSLGFVSPWLDCTFDDYNPRIILWLESIQVRCFPDSRNWQAFLMHLSKLMRVRDDSCISGNFLCELLILCTSAVDEGRKDYTSEMFNEIKLLEHVVGTGLGFLSSKVLERCSFDTLKAIVKSFSSHYHSMGSTILLKAARTLDTCLLANLQQRTLEVASVLEVYRLFPHQVRENHDQLYGVFEKSIRAEHLNMNQKHLLSRMLDYRKLSDKTAEKIFENMHLGYDPAILARVCQLQKDKLNAFSGLSPNCLSDDSLQAAFELLRKNLQVNLLICKQQSVIVQCVRTLCGIQGVEEPMFQDDCVQ